ncbi:hypothetical protein [Roseomonas sp. AR75]|nr:hypothetical protein [Roseomonas sp. AR75]
MSPPVRLSREGMGVSRGPGWLLPGGMEGGSWLLTAGAFGPD